MNEEPLNFEAYRRQRQENASTVPCFKCRRWIVATAVRCEHCGVNFQGEAQYFAKPDPSSPMGRSWIMISLAIALIAAFALAILK